jgi:hypothetical protein
MEGTPLEPLRRWSSCQGAAGSTAFRSDAAVHDFLSCWTDEKLEPQPGFAARINVSVFYGKPFRDTYKITICKLLSER